MERAVTARAALVGLVVAAQVVVGSAMAQEQLLQLDHVSVDGYPQVGLTVTIPGAPLDDIDGLTVSLHENGVERSARIVDVDGTTQEVVLVVDVSGSMSGAPIAAARAAASSFVARARPGMRVGLVSFATHVDVIAAPTRNHELIATAIDGLSAGGRTALYDAVVATAGVFSSGSDRTRTVVLLSDGEDNESAADLAAAAQAVSDADVTLYAIELATASSDLAALEALVGSTGGWARTAADATQLDDVYAAIADEVVSQAGIVYESGAHGPARLDIEVTAGQRSWRLDGHPIVLPTPDSADTAVAAPPVSASPGRPPAVSPGLLLVGLLLAYAAVALAFRTLWPAPARIDVSRRAGLHGHDAFVGLLDRALLAAEQGVRNATAIERVGVALSRAGATTTPSRFVIRLAMATVIALVLGWMLGGPAVGLVLTLLVLAAPKAWLARATRRRQALFADQLDDTLQLLAGSLRAGHSLMQAMDTVAQEAPEPTATEFRRIVNVTRVGQDLSSALAATVERTGSNDLEWVAQAIAIHREVGGNLAGVLDTVSDTIRERNQIRRQVSALSAEGRLSALILMGLPVVIVLFLAVVNPSYLTRFIDGPAGWLMIAMIAGLMTTGGLWLRALVRIDV